MKYIAYLVALANLMAAVLAAPVQAQPAASPWAQYGNDPGHTSLSQYAAPFTSAQLLWRAQTNDVAYGVPTIGANGLIYARCRGTVYCFGPMGNTIWQSNVGGSQSHVSLDSAGNAYVGGWNGYTNIGNINSFNASGQLNWSLSLGTASATSDVTIAPNGTLYATNSAGHLFSIAPNGSVNWDHNLGTASDVYNVAVAHDGSIYASTGTYGSAGSVYKLNADGSLAWQQHLTGGPGNVVVGSSGNIFVSYSNPSSPADVSALSQLDGHILWTVTATDGFGWHDEHSTVALDRQGNVLMTLGALLRKIDGNTGAILWSRSDLYANRSVTVDSNGTIYASIGGDSHPDALYAINTDGTTRWVFSIPGNQWIMEGASIGPDGTVYFDSFGSNNGYVYAVVPEPATLALLALGGAGLLARRRAARR